MIEGEKTIDGFFDGTLAMQILYSSGIILGSLLLTFTVAITFLNERKYLNMVIISDTIEDRLRKVDEDGNKAIRENENMLIYAKGDLSFPVPAKDDQLSFEAPNGIVLYSKVEIYQWFCRKVFRVDKTIEISYKKIWSL